MSTTGWIILFLAAMPAIILHEVAHGYVANIFGDPTAKNAGRLTLNPVKHVDPFGTILMPLLLAISGLPAFGYAKPVPVNVSRLRDPRNQSVWVSLAGPATNIVLCIVAWAACRIAIPPTTMFLNNFQIFLIDFGVINVTLAAVNMLPIPPLDGSALLERMVPRKHLGRYFELRARALPFALIALLILMLSGAGSGLLSSLQNFWINLI